MEQLCDLLLQAYILKTFATDSIFNYFLNINTKAVIGTLYYSKTSIHYKCNHYVITMNINIDANY